MNVELVKYPRKLALSMAKYFTYEGKQVGFVRKMIDEVVMIEESWVNEMNRHFAKNGYDDLLTIAGKVLQDAGHPAISRAQAWIVLDQLTREGVPQALHDIESDEEIGAGVFPWLGKAVKTTVVAGAEVVDTVVTKPVQAVTEAILPDKTEEVAEESEEGSEEETEEETEEVVESDESSE